MNEQEKVCAIFAADPMEFPWGYDEEAEDCILMKQKLNEYIDRLTKDGYLRFHAAMDNGFGLYAAEYILALRREDPRLFLCCYLPGEDQATKWTPEHRERYFNALAGASEVVTVSAEDSFVRDYDVRFAAGDMAQVIIVVTASIMTDSPTEQAKRDLYIRYEKELIEIDQVYGVHRHEAW